MARKPRIESNQGLYHVINRGNDRSHIFKTEGAKRSFTDTLFEACDKFGWELYAYCIMRNHYHLCIGTPHGNLSAGMRWFQATFAVRFNKFRKGHGHLFQGRFKSLAVEPGEYWLALVDYIHLNPVRAGLVNIEGMRGYPWTSLFYFPKRASRPPLMKCDWMTYFTDFDDSKGGWIRYQNYLQLKASITAKQLRELDHIMCKGWSVGSEVFSKTVLEDLNKNQLIQNLVGEELSAFNKIRWETGLRKCLDCLGKSLSDAPDDKRSADWKLAIASKLKRETSVTNAWLTSQLHMGTPRSVSAVCGVYKRDKESTCVYAKSLKKLIIDH